MFGKRKKAAEPQGKMRIRRGDTVVVNAGKDKGAQGKVLRVLPEKGRVVVEGVNMIKRATRANPQKNIKGGVVEKEAPIAASNVMLLDPEAEGGKPTRTGIRIEGGERVRYAKKSGATISTVTAAAEE
jgi:large subunit ribosomal protein L24